MKKKNTKDVGISFNVILESIDKTTGRIIKRIETHNLIVNTGLERIAKLLGGVDAVGYFSHIAVGTDATTVTATDIALGAEVERESATISYEANYKCKFQKVFSVGSGVSYNIKEVGIFNSAIESGSIMWARVNADNTLDADTDLSVTMTYTMARV